MAPQPPSQPLEYRQDAPTPSSKLIRYIVLAVVYVAGTLSWLAWLALFILLLFHFFSSGRR